MVKLLNSSTSIRYIKFLLVIILILLVYSLLSYFRPGLNDIPTNKKRDASGMFYTEVENIDDLICVGAATSCEK